MLNNEAEHNRIFKLVQNWAYPKYLVLLPNNIVNSSSLWKKDRDAAGQETTFFVRELELVAASPRNSIQD